MYGDTLKEFLVYSLEHTIGLRDQYILEFVVNNISNYATVASLCPTFNSNNIHQVITTFAFTVMKQTVYTAKTNRLF